MLSCKRAVLAHNHAHPGVNDVKAYKAIEKFVEEGKIRSIGLSNWYIEEIDGFISQVNIMPALVQNEIHPYYQEQAVVPLYARPRYSCASVVSVRRQRTYGIAAR